MTPTLRTASVILALALAGSACSSGPRTTPEASGTTGTTTSPTAAAMAGHDMQAMTSAAPSTTATATAPSTTASSKAGTETKTETKNDPPAPGTYRYTQTGSTKSGAFELTPDPEGTLVVDAATAADNGQRQKQTRHVSSNSTREQTLLFRADGIYIESLTTTFGPQQVTCRPTQPLNIFHYPITVGDSWTGNDRCEAGTLTFTAKVVRAEQRSVGGRKVDTYLIHHVFHLSGSTIDEETDLQTWLSPVYRLSVHVEEHTKGTMQGTQFTEELTQDLISATPS